MHGGENQVALQEYLQVLAEAVKKPCWKPGPMCPNPPTTTTTITTTYRSLQSLWPVTPLPKLELICGIQCASLSLLSGMLVSAECIGSKHTQDTSALLGVTRRITLISPARLDSSHISQANSGPRSSLSCASYEIITCPRS